MHVSGTHFVAEKPSFPLSLPSPRDFFSQTESLFTGYISSPAVSLTKNNSRIVPLSFEVFDLKLAIATCVFYCVAK